jgi:hypothetical protein
VGGRGRWRGVGGLIVVGPVCRFGLGFGCETAADEVLQGDHGGLLRRRDIEVQVGGAAAEADGDVEGGRCGREEEGGWTAREKRTGVSGRSGRGGCGGGGRRAAGPAGALASGVAHLWPRFSVWECGVGVVVSDDQYGHLSRIQIDIASIPTSCPGCWLAQRVRGKMHAPARRNNGPRAQGCMIYPLSSAKPKPTQDPGLLQLPHTILITSYARMFVHSKSPLFKQPDLQA